MTTPTLPTTPAPRCACPAGECRHGSRWAAPDASQARVAVRTAADRPGGGYAAPTRRDAALRAAAETAGKRSAIDTATVGRMLRTIGACAVVPVSAADRDALAGTRFVRGREATAVAKRVGCPTCPVRDACARWAVAMGQDAGLYGGMADRARRVYVATTAPAPIPAVPAADMPAADMPDTRTLADRLAAEAARRAERDALARAAFALRHRAR